MDPTVSELAGLLARGVHPEALSGTFRWQDSDSRQREWKVWRHGRRARIEEPAGVVSLIASENSYWVNWASVDGIFAVPRRPDHDDFELSRLTMLEPESYWRAWLTMDEPLVESTIKAVEHQGRTGWQFVSPETKGVRLVLTVDQETGLLLRSEHPDAGVIEEWLDVSVQVPDEELFVYTGEWHRSSHFARRYPPAWEPT